MSGSNINANINANAAQFNSAMAAAAASTQQFAQQAQAAFAAAAASMAQSSAAMAAAAASAAASAGNLNNRVNTLGISAGYTGRKLSAMLDEAIAGRWRQFDSTLAGVVGTMGRLNLTMTASIGIIAAVAAGVAALAISWHNAEQNAVSAAGAMTLAGTNVGHSIEQMGQEASDNAKKWHLWGSTSQEVTKTLAGLSGSAAQFRGQLTQLANAQSVVTNGSDVTKIAQEYFEAFNKGGSGALQFADKLHLLEPAQRAQVQAMVEAKQDSQAMSTVIDAMNNRFGKSGEQLNANHVSWTQYMRDVSLSAEGDMDATKRVFEWGEAHKKMVNDALTNKVPAMAPQARDDAAAVTALDKATQQRTVAQLELNAALRAQEAAKTTGDGDAARAAANAIIEAQNKIAATHDASEQQMHATTVASLEAQIAANADHADRVAKFREQIAAEDKRYFAGNVALTRTSADQATAAERQAADAALRINMAKIEGKIQQARAGGASTASLYDQQLALLRAADKQDTLEYQNILNQKAVAGVRAGNTEVKSEEDALRAKQELYGRDYAAKLQIEDQILAIVKAHYGAQSVQYQQEMIRRNRLLEEQAQQAAEIEQTKIASSARVNATQYQDLKKVLDTEVAQYQITKRQELDALDEFQQKHDQILIAMLDKEIASLAAGTVAQQQAIDKRDELMERMKQQHDTIADQVAEAEHKASEKATESWARAFDGIAQASKSALTGMINGTTTFQGAMKKIASSVLDEFTSMALKMLGKWVATELAKTASSATQNAVREAQDQQGESGLITLLLRSLGIYTATESAKTASTVTNTAARTGVGAAANAQESSWFLVRAARWIASELGMTSSTTAQSVARVGAQSTADTTANTAAVTSNVSQALSYAAVGGAAAGASTAAIPFVGAALAPAAAASTYADLASFAGLASLATGTMNVPQDMVANIHQGEMVVPKTFASGIRDLMGGGGGSKGNTTTHNNSSINYAPSFSGGAGDMHTTARNNFKEFKEYLNNVTRNGALMVPGR